MTAEPNDPLFQYQWFLDNTGQSGGGIGSDIDVLSVWPDYTGSGIRVAIVDDGVQLDHPDLEIDTNLSWDAVNKVKGGGPTDPDEKHGTPVAGLVGELANNGIGGSGVAPDAMLISYRIGFDAKFVISAPTFAYQKALDEAKADVVNNSWGSGKAFLYDALDADADYAAFFAALNQLGATGRGGLGSISLFANGNDGRSNYDGNLSNNQNSRYVIAVGAVDDNGVRSAYSTPGANLLVSAPGGASTEQHDDRPGNGTLTTDLTGNQGYNRLDGEPGNYDYNFSGTSAATPIVSGIVALMLDANAALGYRDVQEILAHSARFVDPGATSWMTMHSGTWNGGGAVFSRDYGFGEVDAHAAVRLAEVYPFLYDRPRSDGNVINLTEAVTSEATFNDKTAATIEITLPDTIDLNHLDLTLKASIADISKMTLTLMSPSGSKITLLDSPQNPPWQEGQSVAKWPDKGFSLGTDAFWGEKSGDGVWTVTVSASTGGGGTIESVSLSAYGDARSAQKEFVYTDDFGHIIDADSWQQQAPSRLELEVGAGETAVIDAAAVSSDVVVDLANHRAVITGETVTIDVDTKVTKIFSGDGDDRLVGDGNDNALLAGRGHNTLDGGGGIDTALYIGSRAGYTATYGLPGTFAVETLSHGTSDVAVRIEKATFAEGTLYVQAVSDTGLGTAALYNGLLFRDADAGGYRYWTNQAAAGTGLSTIANSFLASAEYANGAGKLDNTTFLQDVYQNMLNRPIDAGGAAYWNDQLTSGALTRAGVVISIDHSDEYQTTQLTGVFSTIASLGNLWG